MKIRAPDQASLVCFIALLACFPFSDKAAAQSSAASPDTSLADLSSRLVEPLQKLGVKKVVVWDLRTSAGPHPKGPWLAEQIAAQLQARLPDVQFTANPPIFLADLNSHEPKSPPDGSVKTIPSDAAISGTFDLVGKQLEITLQIDPISKHSPPPSLITGRIPIPEEMRSWLVPDSGIQRAGFNPDFNPPHCKDCPPPPYTAEARRAKFDGTVVLLVTISERGKVTDAIVKRGVGMGMGEVALATVSRWKFEPATGHDGKPIAVSIPPEISFRMFGN